MTDQEPSLTLVEINKLLRKVQQSIAGQLDAALDVDDPEIMTYRRLVNGLHDSLALAEIASASRTTREYRRLSRADLLKIQRGESIKERRAPAGDSDSIGPLNLPNTHTKRSGSYLNFSNAESEKRRDPLDEEIRIPYGRDGSKSR